MTPENLRRGNELLKKIDELEKQIKAVKHHSCDWIEFNFGNGGNHSIVCNTGDIIAEVRELILRGNERSLKQLKEEFAAL